MFECLHIKCRKAIKPDGDDRWIIEDTDGGTIALLYTENDGDLEANAHLIAAAPELYEALKLANEYITYGGQTIKQKIGQALAKAEGKGTA